jgi:hypothetical protein
MAADDGAKKSVTTGLSFSMPFWKSESAKGTAAKGVSATDAPEATWAKLSPLRQRNSP